MEQERVLMSQRERDRLKVLDEVKRGHLKQWEASQQMGLSERQVRRLVRRMKQQGDRAVVHGLRGRPSNRKIPASRERKAVSLVRAKYRDFGPTLASEYLAKDRVVVSRETLRKWMMGAGIWRGRRRRIEPVHLWRARRSCFGELVQWDTSEHDWLEGRGEKLLLVGMIDDASSRARGRFVYQDSTAENMRVLWDWLERYGRPVAFYTDKASLFETNRPQQRDEELKGRLPKTQIGRALEELGIEWIPAHSPQAKGRIERFFGTLQDRLVKGLRLAGVKTLEQANRYLEEEFWPLWEERFTREPANSTNVHRPLGREHDLAAILSQVESRVVMNDYTLRLQGQFYQVAKADIRPGLRGARVRVEKRLDGSVAVRYQERYVGVKHCPAPLKPPPTPPAIRAQIRKKTPPSPWMRGFNLQHSPPLWKILRQEGTP